MPWRDYQKGIRKNQIILMLVLVLALYVVVPQLTDLQSSWQILSRPEPIWLVLAIATTAATYLAASVTYWLLAFAPIRYGRTFLVQLAAMFVNRLLPAGVGAMGVNFFYLRRNRHKISQAGSVVAVNNLLGFAGHWLLLAIGLLFYAGDAPSLQVNDGKPFDHMLEFVTLGLLITLTLLLILGRHRFTRTVVDLWSQLSSFRQRPRRVLAALMSSMLLTLAHVLSLACCALALGVSLPLVVVLLVFTFGVSAAAVTPTPGGLGGYEAGLFAGFVAYGVGSASALAIALLYRLISYWLALAVGAVAFVVAQRRGVLGV